MKYLLIVGACCLLFACNKNKEAAPPQNELLLKMQAHHWLLDSVQIHQGDSIYTIIEGEPSMELYFSKDRMTILVPSGPTDERYYWLVEPNKIYNYKVNNNRDMADSFFVATVSNSLLVLTTPTVNGIEYDYHHAK